MPSHVATCITLIRILLIPFLVNSFLAEKPMTVLILFSIATITDWLDGYLARLLQQTSALGAWLDPVADKLLIMSTLILLVSEVRFHPLRVPAFLMIGRDLVISALREWMAISGRPNAVSVSSVGKWKTAIQMLAISLCLFSKVYPKQTVLITIAYRTFYIATLLSIISLIHYIWCAWLAMQ